MTENHSLALIVSLDTKLHYDSPCQIKVCTFTVSLLRHDLSLLPWAASNLQWTQQTWEGEVEQRAVFCLHGLRGARVKDATQCCRLQKNPCSPRGLCSARNLCYSATRAHPRTPWVWEQCWPEGCVMPDDGQLPKRPWGALQIAFAERLVMHAS